MTAQTKVYRYWGDVQPPKSKAEFFDAVTTPAPSGDGKIATIRMYGPIDSWGGFWGISTKDVGAVLDGLPDTVTQIVLRINSPGGEVFEGLAILNMLRAHKAKVTAVVDGLAASAASVIASGCDETVMSPGTQMMIHSPWIITGGNAAELRKTAAVLDGIEASLIEIYTAKAGQKDWAELLAADTWLTAAKTVEMGLADRVAVIPDAGETETVGADEPDSGDDGEIDNASRIRPAALSPHQVTAAHELPSSSEPGDPNRKESVVAYDDLKAGFANRLGITEAAVTDEMLFAALDETLAEQAEPTAETVTVPEGSVLVEAGAFKELQDNAALGAKAFADQQSARRDAIVAGAVSSGRIRPVDSAQFRELIDKDEEGITKLLASYAANTVPVSEIGHSNVTEASADDDVYNALFGDHPTEKGA